MVACARRLAPAEEKIDDNPRVRTFLMEKGIEISRHLRVMSTDRVAGGRHT